MHVNVFDSQNLEQPVQCIYIVTGPGGLTIIGMLRQTLCFLYFYLPFRNSLYPKYPRFENNFLAKVQQCIITILSQFCQILIVVYLMLPIYFVHLCIYDAYSNYICVFCMGNFTIFIRTDQVFFLAIYYILIWLYRFVAYLSRTRHQV